MTLRLAPIDLASARAWIQRVHSHLDAPIGGKAAVAIEEDGRLCCVALLGRPNARALQAQGCAEVLRVASDRTPHAAGMALAAITRAALSLGYTRIVSSTLLGEKGTMYRGTGWRPVACRLLERGPELADWRRKGRSSKAPTQAGAKVRWEAGPSALPENPKVAAFVLEMAGKVELLPRRESLPLLALMRTARTA